MLLDYSARRVLGCLIEDLPLLDPVPVHSIERAREYLLEIGAIDASKRPTAVGHAMARIPVDLSFSRWLVAAEEAGCLGSMITLVSTLSARRHYLRTDADLECHPILASACDATAILSAHGARRPPDFFARSVFSEARVIATQLRRQLNYTEVGDVDAPLLRRSIAQAVMVSNPSSVYVIRLRQTKESAWNNGNAEARLDAKRLMTRKGSKVHTRAPGARGIEHPCV